MRDRAMRGLAEFNRHVTNPVLRHTAARIPGYANVVHRGRRSGRRYRTPVGTTWNDGELRIAVNYGRRSDWVRNVLAAGTFDLEHRGSLLHLHRPRLETVDGRELLVANLVN